MSVLLKPKTLPNPNSAVARGRRAEELARKYLEKLGYRILETNWRSPAKQAGEVDVVARDGDTICLVEVRSRGSADFGHPLETIDARKQKRLRAAALAYLGKRGPAPVRFDVVAVIGDQVELVKNAFE